MRCASAESEKENRRNPRTQSGRHVVALLRKFAAHARSDGAAYCSLPLQSACQILFIDPRLPEGPPPDYAARVNRAVDHVLLHLDEPLRLEDVAAVAGFSRFHFHRIFRVLMGETLQRFVKRVRLERALSLMSRTPRPRLTDVAFACGFSSSSDFTRSFKQRYGVAPGAFDVKTWRDGRREELRQRVESMRFSLESPARYHIDPPLAPGENPDGFEVGFRELSPRRVAYLRVVDPFEGTNAFDACNQLVAWAQARGLADGQWLGYMWDDPEVVALADCRYDLGVVIAPSDPTDGVSVFDSPAMRVAEVRISGDLALETRALDWLFDTWPPASGCLPDDQPGFEAWIGLPFAHGVEHFEQALHLPVLRGRMR